MKMHFTEVVVATNDKQAKDKNQTSWETILQPECTSIQMVVWFASIRHCRIVNESNSFMCFVTQDLKLKGEVLNVSVKTLNWNLKIMDIFEDHPGHR